MQKKLCCFERKLICHLISIQRNLVKSIDLKKVCVCVCVRACVRACVHVCFTKTYFLLFLICKWNLSGPYEEKLIV